MVKKILAGLAISFISLIICFIVLEVVVRAFFSQELIYLKTSEIWEPDNVLGWKHKMLTSTPVNLGDRKVQFKTDVNGFRIGQELIDSPDYKIFAIGDSFIEGLQVEYEETATAIIESSLSDRLNKKIKVFNAAVAGWDVNQYLIEAKKELPQNDYNFLLVFLYVGNDFTSEARDSFSPRSMIETHDFRIPRSLSRQEIIDSVIYPVNDRLETHSSAFLFLKKRFKVVLMRLGLTANQFPEVFLKSEADSPVYKTTADICLDIEEEASKYGIETVFVLIPTSLEVQEESSAEYIKGFNMNPFDVDINQANRLARKNFEEAGLFLIDPSEKMKQDYASDKERLYDLINDHFTEKGHRSLAEYVTPYLEEKITTEENGDNQENNQ